MAQFLKKTFGKKNEIELEKKERKQRQMQVHNL